MKRDFLQAALQSDAQSAAWAETGQCVWLRDPLDATASLPSPRTAATGTSFALCRVVEPQDTLPPNHALVEILDGQTSTNVCAVSRARLLPADSEFGLPDNAELKHLNYPNVLQNIYERFQRSCAEEERHCIYTYAGWVLFAVNPFVKERDPAASIYSTLWCERYFRKSLGQEPPHPFAIAATAFNKLIADHEPQYILVSGESGAGKTECSKHLLKYLTFVTWRQRRMRGRASEGGPGDVAETLANLLMIASPILEFFGNAKTARNDNSSRFGKLFQIHYDALGEKLLGAKLQTYLLAKSRVVKVPRGEENYHVLHSLIESQEARLQLGEALEKYVAGSRYLGDRVGSKCETKRYQPEGTFAFQKLRDGLTAFEVEEPLQSQVFSLLLGILCLGCIDFTRGAAENESCVENPEVCQLLCKLWQIESANPAVELEMILTSKQIRDARQQLNPSQARQMSDSLAKGVYEAAFHFVVNLIREKLRTEGERFCPVSADFPENEKCVGVLDLFGFENMEPESYNGFEQLCINYANEKLHCHFMQQVVLRERETYQAEGLRVPQQEFADSEKIITPATLSLLMGTRSNPGIFGVLDEVSKLGGADKDGQFCRRVSDLLDKHRLEQQVVASPSKKRKQNATVSRNGLNFVVNHFAEPVLYSASGFADRNQDHISDELKAFLINKGREHSLIKRMFSEEKKAPAGKSLSSLFIKQMTQLTATLEKTSCYFIKCLKPNDQQKALQFDKPRVLSQLITGGVGPVLDLMAQGYPCRLSFGTLWNRYKDFLPNPLLEKMNPRDFSELIMSFLEVPYDQYKMGSSRVFFRFGALEKVETLIRGLDSAQNANYALDFAQKVHSFYIKNAVSRVFCAASVGVRLVQAVRRMRHRRVAHEAARAYTHVYLPRKQARMAVKIQKWVQGMKPRLHFLRLRRATRKLQKWWLAVLAINDLHAAYEWSMKHKHGQVVHAVLVMHLLFRQKESEAREWREFCARKIQAGWRGYSLRQRLVRAAARLKQSAARKVQRRWRTFVAGVDAEQRDFLRKAYREAVWCKKRRRREDGQPPKSPCRTPGRTAFDESKEFWEEATSVARTAHDGSRAVETSRRRRSVFASCSAAPCEAAKCLQVVVGSIGSTLAAPNALSPGWTSPPIVPAAILSPTAKDGLTTRSSRRALEGGSPNRGDTSASVVEMIASRRGKTAGRFSFGSCVRGSEDQPAPAVRELEATLSQPNCLLRRSTSSRLSVRAWQKAEEPVAVASPVLGSKTPRSGKMPPTDVCWEGGTAGDENDPPTPLFGELLCSVEGGAISANSSSAGSQSPSLLIPTKAPGKEKTTTEASEGLVSTPKFFRKSNTTPPLRKPPIAANDFTSRLGECLCKILKKMSRKDSKIPLMPIGESKRLLRFRLDSAWDTKVVQS